MDLFINSVNETRSQKIHERRWKREKKALQKYILFFFKEREWDLQLCTNGKKLAITFRYKDNNKDKRQRHKRFTNVPTYTEVFQAPERGSIIFTIYEIFMYVLNKTTTKTKWWKILSVDH